MYLFDFQFDQFGHQAPGTDDEIHEFCTGRYQTKFDQFKKIEVNGENEDKLFTYLKENSPKEEIKGMKNKMAMKTIMKISKTCVKENDIKWNFTKFLVDREGNVVKKYDPTYLPKDMEADIKKVI